MDITRLHKLVKENDNLEDVVLKMGFENTPEIHKITRHFIESFKMDLSHWKQAPIDQ